MNYCQCQNAMDKNCWDKAGLDRNCLILKAELLPIKVILSWGSLVAQPLDGKEPRIYLLK